MPPSGQQSSEPDSSLTPLWITIGIFCLGGFIWYFFKQEILGVIFTVRHYEADFISFFIPTEWSQQIQKIQAFIGQAKTTGFYAVSYNDMLDVSTQIGNYLRFPVALILIGLAWLIYVGNIISRFKKTYDMKKLLAGEKQNWPQIIPVSGLDLINQDIKKGPWSMSLQPMDFAKKYNLIKKEPEKPKRSYLEEKTLPIAKINKDEARKVFASQIGPYWAGVDNLPIYMKALFAVFAARVNGDRDGAVKLLSQIAASTASGKLDFSGVDALLNKHKDNKLILSLTKRHAFISTVMPSMLELARQDGVLASADFLWLKPVDRRLWFTLNCVGRQTPFPEIAGIFAHWIAEKELGRRLNVPMIEEAVNGLDVAIQEIIYKPQENEGDE